MRLRCNAVLIPLGLAVAGVGSCAESFRTPVTNTAVVSGFRGGKRARARRPGGLRSAVKLGVGILGIGSATVYLCSSLSSGSPLSRGTAPSSTPSTGLRPSSLGSGAQSLPQDKQRTMLEHTTDNYDGVTIEDSNFPDGAEAFKEVLENSLEQWRSEGKKGVWLKIPADRTELVPVSLELGFELHHAEKAYVMLNMWLPTTVNQLPPNASHQVGVGALVLNEKGEVLVVREKHGPLRGTGIWKFPTGLIDAGEDLPDAAAREVLEETGVHAEFDSVLAFRHGHRGLFGKSDLFFVVRMRLKTGTDSSQLQPQASEIEACQWMPRHLFAEQNAQSGTVLLKELATIMEAHLEFEAKGAKQIEAAGGGHEQGVDEDERLNGGRQSVPAPAAFTAKKLESSRKYGGASMLYLGKL